MPLPITRSVRATAMTATMIALTSQSPALASETTADATKRRSAPITSTPTNHAPIPGVIWVGSIPTIVNETTTPPITPRP